MSFQQEWAGLVADAHAKQTTSMQLNGAGKGDPDGKSGGAGDGKTLNVSASVLRKFAGTSEEVSTSFAKADNAAMRETELVPGTMKGFASDDAFKDFQELWRSQMKYLGGLYSGVAKALREAATTFKAEDVRRKKEIDAAVPDQDKPPHTPLVPKKPLYGPYVPTNPPPDPYDPRSLLRNPYAPETPPASQQKP
ncbi:type VII secretion target [Streptomyces qinglanensis]|uniref:type VII secretion target n=1 Tax=Streptomyces qinglanensis TaxID=943816 RepID=UPI003D7652AC